MCKDYYNLKKILDIIAYFKINQELVKQYLAKLKQEEQKKPKEKKLKKRKKNKRKRKSKKTEPKVREINCIKIQSPVYIQNVGLIKKNKDENQNQENNVINGIKIIKENNDILSNPVKKRQRSKKILGNFSLNNNNKSIIKNSRNNNLINRLQTSGEYNIINKNKNDYPFNMDEKQIYKMFLKIHKKTDLELNVLSYKKALQFDKRSYCEYYLSLFRTKHLLFFSFWPSFDYNSRIIKIFLFFFNFTVSFIVNALFFNDDTMHKIYEEKGSFDFIYNIPQILYSSLISAFINGLIQTLAVTNSNFINFKQKATKSNVNIKKEETIKIIKIKLVLFFIISLILLVAFWFYLACFCAVYKNTQIHLIKDTFISFGTSMLYPFGIYLFPGIFRLGALNAKEKDKECMFQFSKVLQLI